MLLLSLLALAASDALAKGPKDPGEREDSPGFEGILLVPAPPGQSATTGPAAPGGLGPLLGGLAPDPGASPAPMPFEATPIDLLPVGPSTSEPHTAAPVKAPPFQQSPSY